MVTVQRWTKVLARSYTFLGNYVWSLIKPIHLEIHGFYDTINETAYGACIHIVELYRQLRNRLRQIRDYKLFQDKSRTTERRIVAEIGIVWRLIVGETDNISFRLPGTKYSFKIFIIGQIQWSYWHGSMHLAANWMYSWPTEWVRYKDAKSWGQVPTNHNPADILSIGTTPVIVHDVVGWFWNSEIPIIYSHVRPITRENPGT